MGFAKFTRFEMDWLNCL